ncbi:MAG: hypothetical protein U0325_20625 [Polyangiales bacterium]
MRPLACLALTFALTRCDASAFSGPFEPCAPSLPCSPDLSCRSAQPAAADGGAQGQLCTRPCTTLLECPLPTTAGVSRVCAVPQGQTAGVCLTWCANDTDCLPGTRCAAMMMNTGIAQRVCVP